MTLTEAQIDKKKTKRVGRVGESPVLEMVTKGGLHMLVVNKNGKHETLGVGSHRAVARHIAGQNAPNLEWSELSKADYVAPEHFQGMLAKYERMTQRIREKQGL